MTVVEAYAAGREKLNPPDDSSKLHPEVLSLINEGIAQNTTGNIFVPKVCLAFVLNFNNYYVVIFGT
jgi:P-type Ca2+ transporter type 2C